MPSAKIAHTPGRDGQRALDSRISSSTLASATNNTYTTMIHYKSIIQVPYGTASKIAKDIGCNDRYVARALRYDSLTAPSQIKIRQLAIKDYGGREVRIVIK